MTVGQIFEENMLVLKSRWPVLAEFLLKQEVESLNAELVEGRESTLSIAGVQLSSRHDRSGEAYVQAASLAGGIPVVHLYGTGLGELPLAFLARADLQKLEIRILNEKIFVLILSLLDQRTWLSDSRVSLSMAGEDSDIRLPFFAVPPELFLASDLNARVRDHLVAELDIPFANARFDPNKPEWIERLESNRALLERDRDVTELFGSRSGGQAWVLAAGPTLASHYPALQKARAQSGGPLLIAVDTALRPLLDNGIKPDFVVSIDRLICSRVLPGERSDGIGLVYFPVLENQLLCSWQGGRYAAYSRSPLFDQLAKSIPKGLLHSDGSVLHSAVDLAVKMGAVQVSLFGADFSFAQGREHAWQVLTSQQEHEFRQSKHWVLNGYGQRVKTVPNLRSYLCGLERYISAHPEVVFLNTSKDGAWIAGAAYHPEFVQ